MDKRKKIAGVTVLRHCRIIDKFFLTWMVLQRGFAIRGLDLVGRGRLEESESCIWVNRGWLLIEKVFFIMGSHCRVLLV